MRKAFRAAVRLGFSLAALPVLIACLELDDREVGVGFKGGGGSSGAAGATSGGGKPSAGATNRGGASSGGGAGGGGKSAGGTTSGGTTGGPGCKASGASCTTSGDCCSTQCIRGACGQCASGSTYCAPRGAAHGDCFKDAVECSTTTLCSDDVVYACKYDVLAINCDTGDCECKDSAFPVFCAPSESFAEAGCWTAGTVCATRTLCDAKPVACSSASFTVDCTQQKCVCSKPEYPVQCAANANYPTANCWSAGTICSTITQCSDGKGYSCKSASQSYDCVAKTCVDGAAGAGGVGGE